MSLVLPSFLTHTNTRTSALLVNHLNTRDEGKGVSICPGPNIAFFDKIVSLPRMIDHIYGKESILDDDKIPHVFVRELEKYIIYLQDKIAESKEPSPKQTLYFWEFRENLMEGIRYYRSLFRENEIPDVMDDLKFLEEKLISIPVNH